MSLPSNRAGAMLAYFSALLSGSGYARSPAADARPLFMPVQGRRKDRTPGEPGVAGDKLRKRFAKHAQGPRGF